MIVSGCVINEEMTDRVVNNVVTVGESEVVVVSKDEVYGGVSTRGDLLLPLMFEYIYSITSGGETSYYIVYNGVDYNATEYIDRMKERLGYNNGEDNSSSQEEENNEPENTPAEGENNNETQEQTTTTTENEPSRRSVK